MISAVEARAQATNNMENITQDKINKIDALINTSVARGCFKTNTGSLKKEMIESIMKYYETLGFKVRDCGNFSIDIRW